MAATSLRPLSPIPYPLLSPIPYPLLPPTPREDLINHFKVELLVVE